MRNQEGVRDFVFVGFNSRIAALELKSGNLVWEWKSPKGTGFVALLLDGEVLVVSICGYTYGLDALTGETIWSNPLQGFGTGTPCLASAAGTTAAFSLLAENGRQQAAAASSSTASS